MPRFAANLSMLFTEVPFEDRFAAAAAAGFEAVEYLFPYDFEAADLAARLDRHRLVQALFNLPAGDWAAGDRGIACDPARVEEFRAGVATAIAYAERLGCARLNCLAGIPPAGIAPAQARATFVNNLRYAAAETAKADLTLLTEPINTRDVPGFFLCHTAQALEILDEVGADNVKLQYDVYHMQIMEGDLAPTLERHRARIGHIQIAENPGRHEPGTGEIDYRFLFAHLDRIGYEGWVGCEYRPAAGTVEGLGWIRPYLERRG